MEQELLDLISDLEDVTALLKRTFVAKDEFIEIMVSCAIAQEHLLVVGPPGTAKSELVKRFALLCSPDGRSHNNGRIPYFEYLFTRFTEPNEIFGPVNISRFQTDGGYQRVTDGMMPQAEIVFFDEVFKANSAILNALLTILNERIFYNGGRQEPVPLICGIGAANEIPDDPTLGAIFDRFLVRVWSDNVEEARFAELFDRGWNLEKNRIREGHSLKQVNITTTDALRKIYRTLDRVNLETVSRDYREVIRRIRAEGISLSDRRMVKLLKLIAASALRRKSFEAHTGDFWILKHIWNSPEQIPHLQAIVDPYLEGYEEVQWSAERSLEKINGDILKEAGRQHQLKTDADFADFLRQTERLRRELLAHSAAAEKDALLEHIHRMIDSVMDLLEEQG